MSMHPVPPPPPRDPNQPVYASPPEYAPPPGSAPARGSASPPGHPPQPGYGPPPGVAPPAGYAPPPGFAPPPGYGPPTGAAGAQGRWSKTLIVGVVAAALGFAEISFSSSRTVNGVVVECDYVNLAPWVFGPLALVCGVLGLVRAGRIPVTKGRDKAMGIICVVVGAVHLLQAFGVLELMSSGPC